MKFVTNIRDNSFRRGLLLAVSAIALTGCVSAVSENMDSAADIKPTSLANTTASEQADMNLVSEGNESLSTENTSPDNQDGISANDTSVPTGISNGQVYGNVPASGGLTTQSTGLSATNSSIFAANGQPPVPASQGIAIADQELAVSTPAFVPIPTANPAFNTVETQEAPTTSTIPETSIPKSDVKSARSGAGDSSKVPLTLTAFFTGASQKRSSEQVAGHASDYEVNPVGISFAGRNNMNEEFDVDHEEEEENNEPVGLMKLASLSGLSRIAPSGLTLQTPKVNVDCFSPELIQRINQIENHYKKPAIVTSGYRPPKGKRRGSFHHSCQAADVQVQGVSKWELAQFLRSQDNRGGVGTYCHTESVHLDLGSSRDWNWRCRRSSSKK